jgi:sugar phosphate isomerase/epimerase
MRLGGSTGCVAALGTATEDALPLLAHAGATSAEVFLQCPDDAHPSILEAVLEQHRRLELPINSVHPPVFLFERWLYSRLARQRMWALSEFERYVRAGQRLGATLLVCHGPPRGLVEEHGRLTDSYLATARDLARLARSYGVRYCIENVDYAFLRTPEDVLAHRELFGDVGLVLDFKAAWKVGSTPAEMLAAMGEDFAYAHISFRIAGAAEPLLGATFRGQDDPELAVGVAAVAAADAACDSVLEVDRIRSATEIGDSLAELRRLAATV